MRRNNYFLFLFICVRSLLIYPFSQAFFAPQDNLTALFIERISAETKSIYGAMYMFTDKKVAQALIDAKKRGVDVQMIVDQISMSSCGKGKILQENGISVYVHRTLEFNPYTMPLMHHKFFIFGCNQEGTSVLWTGSWNCTLRGTQYNNENVILLDDQNMIEQFSKHFFELRDKLIRIVSSG